MARSHTPLSVWFWSAYLVSSQTPGVSAVQLRRQLDLSRYETAFQILHKLRAGLAQEFHVPNGLGDRRFEISKINRFGQKIVRGAKLVAV